MYFGYVLVGYLNWLFFGLEGKSANCATACCTIDLVFIVSLEDG